MEDHMNNHLDKERHVVHDDDHWSSCSDEELSINCLSARGETRHRSFKKILGQYNCYHSSVLVLGSDHRIICFICRVSSLA